MYCRAPISSPPTVPNHGQRQLVIDVAELGVPHRGDSDLPAMWVISVPMAKAMGKPRMLRPGVTIHAPAHAEKAPDNSDAEPRITSPATRSGLRRWAFLRRANGARLPAEEGAATFRSTLDLRSIPMRAMTKSARQPRIAPVAGITQDGEQSALEMALVVQAGPPSPYSREVPGYRPRSRFGHRPRRDPRAAGAGRRTTPHGLQVVGVWDDLFFNRSMQSMPDRLLKP